VPAGSGTECSVSLSRHGTPAKVLRAWLEGRFDLIVKDLEFAETRLERNPPAAEKAVLETIKAHMESEGVFAEAGLTPEELHLIESHAFVTAKPIVVAEATDSAAFDNFLVRVVSASGYISFLTVGGSENRAWLIRKGATAQEAGGAIHTDIQKGFIRVEIIGYDDGFCWLLVD
jgi:ribosome-binding ATPase YchF (GTP1/OBG family)